LIEALMDVVGQGLIRIDNGDDGQMLDEEVIRDVLAQQVDALSQRLTEMKLMTACEHTSVVDDRRRAVAAASNLVESKRLSMCFRLHSARTSSPQSHTMSTP
jgi:hypothetical protein